jgi:hypothetical protein
VEQPVGHVLRGDAQRRAVFHQPDIVDVGHLGAADPLIDPAHDIAKDALGIVVEFVAYSSALQLRPSASGTVSSYARDRRSVRRRSPAGARRRRPHDNGARAASRRSGDGTQAVFAPLFGWPIFWIEHIGHAVGRRPHALADLRLAAKARRRARCWTLRSS